MDFLPVLEHWSERFNEMKTLSGNSKLNALRALANSQLSFPQLGKLDRAISEMRREEAVDLPILRLALIGSATVSHLSPAIRVASFRRGLAVEIFEGQYGSYMQELTESESPLHGFKPDVLLLVLDAHHVAAMPGATAEDVLSLMAQCWTLARSNLHCTILQQTLLPVFPSLLGNNEYRMQASPAAIINQVNALLRQKAEEAGVHLLALDIFFQAKGLAAWYEPALWYKSKHEVHPRAAVLYGDQVARELAALLGMTAKCLVLDLDNTLWGGVIGDDGIDGIVLGQGDAVGEAHLAFQRYCSGLSDRGVILAVCSKNSRNNALLPFRKHPDMLLREDQISCFVANWTDKASNLRQIATTLNIGIDSLVFVDDNPAERALIRRELPEVQVPELPEDPALYAHFLASAGYFEALQLTEEDRVRSDSYTANIQRGRLHEQITDVGSYLDSLQMELVIEPFRETGLARVTQLVNKTNQFNLTTKRYREDELRDFMISQNVITIQARLKDRFGDNGVIAILIAKTKHLEADIDTWLMSCRVLGRRVEEACLFVLIDICKKRGVTSLTGTYEHSERNGIVRDLYRTLGFRHIADDSSTGRLRFRLELNSYQTERIPMTIKEAE